MHILRFITSGGRCYPLLRALKVRVTLLQGSKKLLNNIVEKPYVTTPESKSESLDIEAGKDVQRPIRMDPGKVRLGFIPDEWVTFFYPRTGVTGFYTLCFTNGIYLLSKEQYVLEHNYYGGLSMALLCYLATTRFGPQFAKSVDKYLDEYEALWNINRVEQKKILDEEIDDEERLQFSMEGQLMLVDVKRENVRWQLEEEYRKRLKTVYEGVKKRLDYFLVYNNRKLTYVRTNLREYVLRAVQEAMTPEFLDKYLDYCIDEIEGLFKNHPDTHHG